MLVQIAKARFLPAAEGVIGQRHRDWHIDAHHADVDAVGEIARRIAIAGKDRGAIAIFMIHGKADGLFIAGRAHGGQDRAENFGAIDVHIGRYPVKQMRADEIAVFIALQFEIAPINDKLGPLCHAAFDKAQDIGLGRRRDDGAEIDVVASGVGADFQRFDPGDQLLDQPVGRFLAHGHGHRDRHAALARRAIARTHQRIGGKVHIGVGHDDHVVLGTAKALAAFAVRGCAAVDILRDGGGADKAHSLHRRAVKDRVNRFLVAIDHLQDTIGQTRLLAQLGQEHRAGGVTLGWLEDHRVARGQGRAHFPQGDHGGKVEGRDARDHAQGLAHGIHVDAGAGTVGEIALEQMRRADAELDHLEAALHIALGIGKGLAMLAADGQRQLIHVAVDQPHKRHHHAGAALGVGRTPSDLGAGGRGDGGVKLGFGGQGNAALNFACCGVHDIGAAARCAGDMLAVDPMSDLVHRRLPWE